MTTLLILGGTSEAASLVDALSRFTSLRVITSLAGRTAKPRHLPGEVRVGGFGGIEGLLRFLNEQSIDLVIDATHAFAEQMSRHAHQACQELAIPRLCLIRPPWARHEHDLWHDVPNLKVAAALLPRLGTRVFVTSGQRGIEAFAGLDELWFLIRTVEPITAQLPKKFHWVQARGPFTEAGEVDLMEKHRIDLLVTKASGGSATHGKIKAARCLGIPVVIIKRPTIPPGPKVESVKDAVTWLQLRVAG